MSRTTDLKSLAHPDWPYAGTAHEWRGFVKGEAKVGGFDGRCFDTCALDCACNLREAAVYQKQNFGPDLD